MIGRKGKVRVKRFKVDKQHLTVTFNFQNQGNKGRMQSSLKLTAKEGAVKTTLNPPVG